MNSDSKQIVGLYSQFASRSFQSSRPLRLYFVGKIQSILEIISKGWYDIQLHNCTGLYNETDLIIQAVTHTFYVRDVPRDVDLKKIKFQSVSERSSRLKEIMT
jgi:transcriptional regulator of met regulon